MNLNVTPAGMTPADRRAAHRQFIAEASPGRVWAAAALTGALGCRQCQDNPPVVDGDTGEIGHWIDRVSGPRDLPAEWESCGEAWLWVELLRNDRIVLEETPATPDPDDDGSTLRANGMKRLTDEEIRYMLQWAREHTLKSVLLETDSLTHLLAEVIETRIQRNRAVNFLRLHALDEECECMGGPDGSWCKGAVARELTKLLGLAPGEEEIQ